jgi:hypothetical protein
MIGTTVSHYRIISDLAEHMRRIVYEAAHNIPRNEMI